MHRDFLQILCVFRCIQYLLCVAGLDCHWVGFYFAKSLRSFSCSELFMRSSSAFDVQSVAMSLKMRYLCPVFLAHHDIALFILRPKLNCNFLIIIPLYAITIFLVVTNNVAKGKHTRATNQLTTNILPIVPSAKRHTPSLFCSRSLRLYVVFFIVVPPLDVCFYCSSMTKHYILGIPQA